MIDLMETKATGEHPSMPDDKVIFWDGFLTVLCIGEELDIKKATIQIILAEMAKPVTLAEIRRENPDSSVIIVIYEDARDGAVYKYGNNGPNWEKVGLMHGYW